MLRRTFLSSLALALGAAAASSSARAQAPAEAAALCPAQLAQEAAAAQGKYSFFVFHRADDEPTRAMLQAVQALAAQRHDVAAIPVLATNPAEQAIVRQYDLGRAPMPLTLVTAPNGALTGAYPGRVTAEQLAASFVTPAMAKCMRSMQQGRLVFLCTQTTPQPLVPVGVAEFLADEHYKDRTDVVFVQVSDPVEAELLAELEFNGAAAAQTHAAFFAPPGALVGKFGLISSKAEIAAALHKAGKCCNDPNCKHGQAAQPSTNTIR